MKSPSAIGSCEDMEVAMLIGEPLVRSMRMVVKLGAVIAVSCIVLRIVPPLLKASGTRQGRDTETRLAGRELRHHPNNRLG